MSITNPFESMLRISKTSWCIQVIYKGVFIDNPGQSLLNESIAVTPNIYLLVSPEQSFKKLINDNIAFLVNGIKWVEHVFPENETVLISINDILLSFNDFQEEGFLFGIAHFICEYYKKPMPQYSVSFNRDKLKYQFKFHLADVLDELSIKFNENQNYTTTLQPLVQKDEYSFYKTLTSLINFNYCLYYTTDALHDNYLLIRIIQDLSLPKTTKTQILISKELTNAFCLLTDNMFYEDEHFKRYPDSAAIIFKNLEILIDLFLHHRVYHENLSKNELDSFIQRVVKLAQTKYKERDRKFSITFNRPDKGVKQEARKLLNLLNNE
ncbi:hypothetical protein [Flavobacterium beibuense]|uniref:hypothetical protein n=1 Tax=Flavobacterium beibuense TaxID=657326 RepID=UPI003A8DB871